MSRLFPISSLERNEDDECVVLTLTDTYVDDFGAGYFDTIEVSIGEDGLTSLLLDYLEEAVADPDDDRELVLEVEDSDLGEPLVDAEDERAGTVIVTGTIMSLWHGDEFIDDETAEAYLGVDEEETVQKYEIGVSSITPNEDGSDISWTGGFIWAEDEETALDRAQELGFYRNVRVREIA